jgi:GNAT superfamily N-acetyltransferase
LGSVAKVQASRRASRQAPAAIRPFWYADTRRTGELLAQLGYELPSEELATRLAHVLAASDHHHVAVAEVDEKVVGLLHVYERPALEKPCEAVVQAMVVDAPQRGRGVGTALMQHAEAWARQRGLGSVALATRHAASFYAQLGYGKVASSDLMRKSLCGSTL